MSLRELFDLRDDRLLRYVQDYKVLLIEPFTMNDRDFEKFSTNLGQVLRFMKASSDKKEMAKLMKDEKAYGSLSRKAVRVIRDCAHVNVQMEEKEEINVCKAWEDAMEDAANMARLQEREASQEREKELCKAWEDRMEKTAIRACVEIYRELGLQEADVRARIKERYGLTDELADYYMIQ